MLKIFKKPKLSMLEYNGCVIIKLSFGIWLVQCYPAQKME